MRLLNPFTAEEWSKMV